MVYCPHLMDAMQEGRMEETQLQVWLRSFDTPSEPEELTFIDLEEYQTMLEENEFR